MVTNLNPVRSLRQAITGPRSTLRWWTIALTVLAMLLGQAFLVALQHVRGSESAGSGFGIVHWGTAIPWLAMLLAQAVLFGNQKALARTVIDGLVAAVLALFSITFLAIMIGLFRPEDPFYTSESGSVAGALLFLFAMVLPQAFAVLMLFVGVVDVALRWIKPSGA